LTGAFTHTGTEEFLLYMHQLTYEFLQSWRDVFSAGRLSKEKSDQLFEQSESINTSSKAAKDYL